MSALRAIHLGPVVAALALSGCPHGKDPPADSHPGVPVTDGQSTDGDRGPADGPKPGTGCFNLGRWASSDLLPDTDRVIHPLPAFASGGFFYVHTVRWDGTSSGQDRWLYAARLQADGSLGSWVRSSTDHGGGAAGFAAIDVDGVPYHFRNGHIARYRFDGNGVLEDIELLEASMDASFGGNRYVWDSAVLARLAGGERYLFHLGGFDLISAGYRTAIYRSGVPIGSQFASTGVAHPAARPGKAAVVSVSGEGSHLFTGEGDGPGLWRAEVAADGSLGPFARLADLPAGSDNGRGDLLSHERTLVVVRGAKVYRSTVDGEGALTPWRECPPLPEPQVDLHWEGGHLEAASSAIVDGQIYVTGKLRVHYAPLVADPTCGR